MLEDTVTPEELAARFLKEYKPNELVGDDATVRKIFADWYSGWCLGDELNNAPEDEAWAEVEKLRTKPTVS